MDTSPSRSMDNSPTPPRRGRRSVYVSPLRGRVYDALRWRIRADRRGRNQPPRMRPNTAALSYENENTQLLEGAAVAGGGAPVQAEFLGQIAAPWCEDEAPASAGDLDEHADADVER